MPSFEKSPPDLIDAALDGWLERAIEHGKTLPPK